MVRILRWLVRGITAAIVLAGIGAALTWYLITRSLPEYNGEMAMAGLDGPVEIVRDANAVPHIRAGTEADAYFALGLVHAQDRLWQMELNRRAAQGRLSEYFGDRTVAVDRLVKTLDLYGLSMTAVEHQSEETRAALEAYAAGVNAWIRHVNAEAMGRGAPEFFVYGDGLAPWTPADSIAILKLMALRLSNAASNEVRRARILLELGPERTADILPDYPADAVIAPPRHSSLGHVRHAEAAPEADPEPDPWLQAFGPGQPDFGGASNAWAVDGSRTAAGAPLLANDPHLWLSAPSIWYLVHVEGGGLAAMGGSLPGTPAVLVGRNNDLGWGLTTTGVDDQDIFIERVNPEDPETYLTPTGWAPFETRIIRIDTGARIITETVRATRHGPVLSGEMFDADTITPEGHVAALSWTALDPVDRSMDAALALMKATTVAEGMESAALVLAPAQNVILADRKTVGLVVAGAVPRRRPTSQGRGLVPVPGWLAANDWLGVLSPEEKPREIRPASGAVANANNRLTDAPYPLHLSFDWGDPYRIQRLTKELTARDFHSRNSFVALQYDGVSEMARSVLPLIARELWWQRPSDMPPLKAEVLDRLKNWTGSMDQHAPEPLIFTAWMRALTRRLAEDELGPLFPEIAGPRPVFVERVYRDVDGASVWCDIDKTPAVETCAEIAEAAFDDALAEIVATHGDRIEDWRWGSAHVAVHRHMPFGLVPVLGMFTNIETETSGGSYTLLRGLSTGKGETPYQNVHAAGLRAVYDFADLNRSLIIISTGQSGHPFSRWYDHLASLWAQGEMIPMSMDMADARAGAVGTMTLVPGE